MLEQHFESIEAAEERYAEILASGGPSLAEFGWEAADIDLPDESEEAVASLGDSYTEAARALTPVQREVATSFYFDMDMEFMEAIEAARLVTSR